MVVYTTIHSISTAGDCSHTAFVRKSISIVQLISNLTCFLQVSAVNLNFDTLLLALDLADVTDLGAFLWEKQPNGVSSKTEEAVFCFVSLSMLLLPIKVFMKGDASNVSEETGNNSLGEVFLRQWSTVNFVGIFARCYLMQNYSTKIVSSLLLAKNIMHCLKAVSFSLFFYKYKDKSDVLFF